MFRHLKAQAARNGGFLSEDKKKRWTVFMRQGRESCSVKAVRERFGAEAEEVIKRGAEYPFPGWVNV